MSNLEKAICASNGPNLELDELPDNILLESDEALHSVNEFSRATIGYSLGISDRITVSAVLPYVSRDGFRENSLTTAML